MSMPVHNPVDGHDVPVPHFGVIFEWDDFRALAGRLTQAEVAFVIARSIRWAGQVGEAATRVFLEPYGQALKFQSFRNVGQVLAS
jgi:extradiol dioxygenase family protein